TTFLSDCYWLTYVLQEWTGVGYHCLYYISLILCVLHLIFFAPVLIFIIFNCFLNLLLHIYKRNNGLDEDFSSKSWDNGRFMVASMFSICYELHGMEKIPEGPGLIVYYHGALPTDYCYFICILYIQTGRLCYSVVDHLFSKLPGIQLYLNLLPGVHSGRDESVEILKKGNLLSVAPGRVREAFCSNENYNILWGNHKGFAQVAIDAKVVSGFLYTIIVVGKYEKEYPKLVWFYERSRLPLIPVYGGFPVKLCTYVGDPILYDPNIRATELVEKIKIALETLRDRHQKLPGSILRALLERFDKHQKED
uniref:Phospholipid/glycerol acyltransferase domain-containing protein n=1 Tax=Gopherus evgoodei TaxID=1825980 RepID=A0A8C4WT45_9SAUR